MKHIVDITTSSPLENFDKEIFVNGEHIRLSRYGTNFSMSLYRDLIMRFDGKADVICLSGIPQALSIDGESYEHGKVKEFTPIVVSDAWKCIADD